MKKMMKKTFSLLMIFMLVFTMIPTSTLKVSAKAAAATTQAKKATTKTAKKTVVIYYNCLFVSYISKSFLIETVETVLKS